MEGRIVDVELDGAIEPAADGAGVSAEKIGKLSVSSESLPGQTKRQELSFTSDDRILTPAAEVADRETSMLFESCDRLGEILHW